MVTRVNPSLPAVVTQSRSYLKPIIAVLAFAAIAYLMMRVARSLMGRVQAMIDPDELYEQGQADARNGSYEEAIRKYSLALECNPEDELRPDILGDRAKAYCDMDNLDDGLADYQAALECTADAYFLALAHLCIAEVLVKKNEHMLAVQGYTEGLKLADPDSRIKQTLLFKRACSQVVLDADVKAIEDFTGALACTTGDKNLRARILAFRAATYLKMKEMEQARQGFTDAAACDCDEMELRRFIYFERGGVYSLSGEHQLAIDDYEKALRSGEGEYSEHRFAQIVCRRGFSYAELGDQDQAIADFTDANDCEFNDPNLRASILGARAKLYVEQQKFDDALKDLTDAIHCEPPQNLDLYLYQRGLVLNHLGRYPKAIEDFTHAMESHLLPTQSRAEILLQIGIAHRENNNLTQARRNWETALKCVISPQLTEAINAELNSKGPPKAVKTGTLWGWARSKWTGDPT